MVSRYKIVEELGRGGMGVAYRARHVELEREVAPKLVLGAAADCTADDVKRFHREGGVSGRCSGVAARPAC